MERFTAMLPTGDFVSLPTIAPTGYLVRANNGVFYSGHWSFVTGRIVWTIADVPANYLVKRG